MLIDEVRDELRRVDVHQRRTGREALRGMVRTGQISRDGLQNAVAVKRGYRKSIQYLTVKDLIDMGIITVVEEAVA